MRFLFSFIADSVEDHGGGGGVPSRRRRELGLCLDVTRKAEASGRPEQAARKAGWAASWVVREWINGEGKRSG
jgi:hypothetical protein